MNPEITNTFFCIEGNIGSGKTTLATMLSEELNTTLLLEQFSDNPFLPEFYKNRERYAFAVEVFFLAERHKQMKSTLASHSLFSPGVVSDYCFDKTAIFASQNLVEKELILFLRLYNQLEKSIPDPTHIIYLDRPIDALISNINKRGRDFEKLITDEYLLSINNAYYQFFNASPHLKVSIIRLADLNFLQDYELYGKIKEIVLQIPEKSGIYYHDLN